MKNLLLPFLLAAGLVSASSCGKDDKPTPAAPLMSVTGKFMGANEVPAVTSNGTGEVTATFNKDTNELAYTITYSGLSGAATGGHFHIGAPGTKGPVSIYFADSSLPPPASPITGKAVLTLDQRDALLSGNLYGNLHTVANPGGEIRANVVAK